MNEIWKDIEGFPYYQVSNLGRVRSFKWGKERILKQEKSRGYLRVSLSKNNNSYHKLVHRLVAEAFLDNPNNLPQVNHINEVKTDNRVENLEYCSMEYNQNYGTHQQRSAITRLNHSRFSKRVLQYSLDGVLLSEFPSTKEVERQLGFGHSNIAHCCLGKCKQMNGFIWRYKNEE